MSQGVPREEIFVTSKVPPAEFGYVATQAAVERMLAELHLEYIDLVLLHWAGGDDLPCADGGSYKRCRQESWLALEGLKSRGLVRALGVSNFGPRQMAELNQLEFHPWVPDVHRETVAWCLANNVVPTAYG